MEEAFENNRWLHPFRLTEKAVGLNTDYAEIFVS